MECIVWSSKNCEQPALDTDVDTEVESESAGLTREDKLTSTTDVAGNNVVVLKRQSSEHDDNEILTSLQQSYQHSTLGAA